MTDIHFIDLFQIFNNPPPKLEFILPGFLNGTVGSIVSMGGLGKTMFTLQLAIQKSCQHIWFDFIKNENEEKILYLSAEDHEIVLKSRIYNICKDLPYFQLEKISKNFHLINPLIGKCPNLLNKEWYGKIKKICEGFSLVIFDTLRRFHDGDENSSSEMNYLISLLEGIASDLNCCVLFLHHVNKGLSSNTENQQSTRGSSVLVDNIRWQAYLSHLNSDELDHYKIDNNEKKFFVKFGISKCNYGEPFKDIILKRTDHGLLLPLKTTGDINCSKKGGRSND